MAKASLRASELCAPGALGALPGAHSRLLARILNSLEAEIYELSADPFDDELLS